MQTSTLSKRSVASLAQAQLCSVVFAKSFFSVMPSETGWNQEPAAGTTCQCPCPFHPIKTGAWRTCGHVRSKWRSGVARLIRSLSLRLPQGMASQICASGFPSASYSGSSQESVPCNSLLPRNRFENSAQVRQKFFQNHRLEPKFLRILLTTPLNPPYPAPKVSLQKPCANVVGRGGRRKWDN